MNTIVFVVAVVAVLAPIALISFIVGWASSVVTVELPAPIIVLPSRIPSTQDPGRILRRRLLQEKSPELAAWFKGSETCDRLHRQRKGHTVWGQPQMYRTAIHHPIMRWDLVKNTTGITRGEMGPWYARQVLISK